ncbi:MAG TPA: septal ring lytic transglycosylase RlpA family protein [Xanthobacteraceae bacterium]|jgi:rare lipoprotein A
MLQGRRCSEWSGIALASAIGGACLLLAGCGGADKHASFSEPAESADPEEPIAKGGGTYRVGRPYTVRGRPYFPAENVNYRVEGIASWYGPDFHNRRTANGETFDMHAISAAHPTMPLPSYARVSNLANGRSLIVRVNDRGPFKGNRVVDVSGKAAELLGFRNNGLAQVRVEYVGRASVHGSDDRILMATLRNGEPAPAPSHVMVASARPLVPEVNTPVQAGQSSQPSGPAQASALAGAPREGSRREAAANGAQPVFRPSSLRGALPEASSASGQEEPASGAAFSRGRGLY